MKISAISEQSPLFQEETECSTQLDGDEPEAPLPRLPPALSKIIDKASRLSMEGAEKGLDVST